MSSNAHIFEEENLQKLLKESLQLWKQAAVAQVEILQLCKR